MSALTGLSLILLCISIRCDVIYCTGQSKNNSGTTYEKMSCGKHVILENHEWDPKGPLDQIVLKNLTDDRLECCLQNVTSAVLQYNVAIFIEEGDSFTLPTFTDQLANITTELHTQSIDILNVGLAEIPTHGFSIFKHIYHIELKNNSLKTLHDESFYNLTELRRLTIVQNDLRYIPKHAFSGLQIVQSINLQGNKIVTLEEEAFHDLPRLTTINLSHNMIHALDQRAFSLVPSLISLSLEHNSLASLPIEFDVEYPHVKLLVDHNPWHCNCSLKWLIQRVSKTSSEEETMCAFPENVTMQGLNGSELPCATPVKLESKNNVLVIVLAVFGGIAIFCIVFSLLCTLRRMKIAKQKKVSLNNRHLSSIQQPPCSMINNHNYNRLCSHSSSLSSADSPYMNNSTLKVGKLLGSGAFGEVFEGYSGDVDNGNRKVAIKMIRENSGAQDLTALDQEFKQLTQIDTHPNIIQVFSTGKIDGSYVMVMEMAEHGDLLTYLRNIYREEELLITSMDQSEERFYLPHRHPLLFEFTLHVARGMEYLSHLKIVHRDLAARNILICDGPVAKIADFGLSRDVYESGYYYQDAQGRLPYKWLSPETLLNGKTTLKSDVWSFGVLIWEVVTLGSNPYPGIPPSMLMDMYRNNYVMSQPNLCPNELYEIMKRCWDHSVDTRPSFTLVAEMLELYIELIITKKEPFIVEEGPPETLSLVAGVD